MLLAILLVAPLAAGCSPQSAAQEGTPTPTVVAEASPTALAAATTGANASPETGSPQPEATGTATGPTQTPTPRPTPEGTPPPPMNVLNIFSFFPSSQTLVKRDTLQLDGDSEPEIIFTVAEAGETITSEMFSGVRTLDYDTTYREWRVGWVSQAITGTASPLPAYDPNDPNRADAYNGRDLLRTGAPIFLARTTTVDGRAHLYMWRWDSGKKSAEALKMADAADGPIRDAHFEADLDVKVADLDDDGVYEVVADNLKSVQVWTWDGSRYVPEGGRR